MTIQTFFKSVIYGLSALSLSSPMAQAVKSAGPVRQDSSATNAYPSELQGSYRYMDQNFPDACGSNAAMVFQKNARYDDTGSECKITKATGGSGQYSIQERCAREGRSRTQSITVSLSGDLLNIKDGGSSFTLKKCGAAATSSNTSASPVSVKKCTVNPGQAGVTTFLDEKLKRQGSSVRDFDTDYFVAEKTVTIDKSQVLVGKLYSGNGKVKETKSFAYADEWTCK